jgi:hypothetical protein
VTTTSTSDARTKQVRIVGGALLLGLGLVPWVVNWPYLFGSDSANRVAGWVATACGTVAIAAAIWIFTGMRSRGRAPELTGQRWRYIWAGVMLAFCLLILFLALGASQPHVMTGVAALLMVGPVFLLFEPAGSAQQATAPLTPAQYRTWLRILGASLAVGLVIFVGAGVLGLNGHYLLAGFFLPFGLIFAVFSVIMWMTFLRHQRRALQDSLE